MSTKISEHNGNERKSLVTKFAHAYGVEPDKMLKTLTSTAFRQGNNQAITNEQMMALLIVADQHSLNPFTSEIYAFPSQGGIVPIVGVDGWARIINQHSAFDGMNFELPETDGLPPWIECTIYRKDRNHPIQIREYMDEVRRDTKPWKTHPRRMLRHKAMIQCARLAFSFVGIYDQDEGERVIEGEATRSAEAPRPVNSGYKPITEDQAATLQALIDETGADKAALLAALGIESLIEISANCYPLVIDRLREEQAEDA